MFFKDTHVLLTAIETKYLIIIVKNQQGIRTSKSLEKYTISSNITNIYPNGATTKEHMQIEYFNKDIALK